MSRRRSLTDRQVARIQPGTKRQTIADPELAGLYLRVTPAGVKSFVVVARSPSGKQVWATLGRADHLIVDEARARARIAAVRIKKGLPPKGVTSDTFKTIAEGWYKRHVEAVGLSSRAEPAHSGPLRPADVG